LSRTPKGQAGTKKRGRELATRSRFTDEEIERGLVALALYSGNSRRASKALGAQGFKVGQSSLHRFRNRFPEKYEQLRRDVLPQLREYAAERHMELADFEVGVAWKIAQQLDEQHGKIPARDLPGALRNVGVSAAVHTDKAQTLRGEPSQVVGHRSLDEVRRALEAKGVKFIPEAQVRDAEVVGELPGGEETSSSDEDAG
jgi:hypothetical protein